MILGVVVPGSVPSFEGSAKRFLEYRQRLEVLPPESLEVEEDGGFAIGIVQRTIQLGE